MYSENCGEDNYPMMVLQQLKEARFNFEELTEGQTKTYIFTVLEDQDDHQQVDTIQQSARKQPEREEIPLLKAEKHERHQVPKNLIKNLVCAFTNYFNSPAEQQHFLEYFGLGQNSSHLVTKFRHNLASLQKSRRYNMQMLEALIGNHELRAFFQLFIEQKARQWVKQGRMRNKPAHLSAIHYLQKYLQLGSQNHTKLRFNSKLSI